MNDLPVNLANLVQLTDPQWTMGSLILTVSYGANFAFVLYFLMTSLQLVPRYRIVAVLSAVVMASSGLNLLSEASAWAETYSFSALTGLWTPGGDGQTFSNAYRYGNWTITVPLLLTQLPIALGLARGELHARSARMIVAGLLMVWTGLMGQFGEVNDLARLNLWGVISSVFFAWLLWEVRGVIVSGMRSTAPELQMWPRRLFWYMVATWGIYPIAYAVPQLAHTGDMVVTQQLLFSIADITTKLIYGVILSRFCLRRGALEGFRPSVEALAVVHEPGPAATGSDLIR